MTTKLRLSTLFAILAMVSTAQGQSMELTVSPDPLIRGGLAEVGITNGPANTTVTVEIDDGGENTSSIDVELDANGNGTAHWDVPMNWDLAKFNYGDKEVARQIVSPDVPD